MMFLFIFQLGRFYLAEGNWLKPGVVGFCLLSFAQAGLRKQLLFTDNKYKPSVGKQTYLNPLQEMSEI